MSARQTHKKGVTKSMLALVLTFLFVKLLLGNMDDIICIKSHAVSNYSIGDESIISNYTEEEKKEEKKMVMNYQDVKIYISMLEVFISTNYPAHSTLNGAMYNLNRMRKEIYKIPNKVWLCIGTNTTTLFIFDCSSAWGVNGKYYILNPDSNNESALEISSDNIIKPIDEERINAHVEIVRQIKPTSKLIIIFDSDVAIDDGSSIIIFCLKGNELNKAIFVQDSSMFDSAHKHDFEYIYKKRKEKNSEEIVYLEMLKKLYPLYKIMFQ